MTGFVVQIGTKGPLSPKDKFLRFLYERGLCWDRHPNVKRERGVCVSIPLVLWVSPLFFLNPCPTVSHPSP